MLRHYIDGLDKENRLIALTDAIEGDAGQVIKDFQDHFRLQNDKPKFDYNTIIVSLYGYLERYIEDMVTEYLGEISSLAPTFTDLPATIQTNHFPFSIELTRKANYQRNAGNVRVEDIIAKLHTCFTSPDNYQLNIQAFTQHSSNFRHATVSDTFKQCGIVNIIQAVKQTEPFIAFLQNEDPDRDVNTYLGMDDDVVFSRLNELADRRNDVAHGTPIDDILANDILRTYIDFIEAFAAGIGPVVYEHILPLMLGQSVSLGSSIGIFDRHIVCVDFPEGKMNLEDILIAKTQEPGRPYRAGKILEIQKDRVSLTSVDGGPGVQIGMRVEFVARENHEFYWFKVSA